MMQKLLRIGILSAAVAAVPVLVFSSNAAAQYRVNQDGHALDSNPNLGGNGNNTQTGYQNNINGNDIVTGNVSGGKQFRGNVPYRAARDFRGAAPGGTAVDNFIKQSSSAADLGTIGSPYRVVPFYGKALTVDPPPMAQPTGIGTGALTVPQPGQFNRPLTPITGDARMGTTEVGPQPVELPAPGQLLLPGPVDPTAGQQFISATPLTGIRQFAANDVGAMGTVTNTQYNPATGVLSAQQIQKMRDEMNSAGGAPQPVAPQPQANPLQQQQDQQQTPAASGAGASGASGPSAASGAGSGAGAGAKGAAGAGQPSGASAINQSLTPNAAITGAQAVNTAIAQNPGAATDQGTRQRLLIPPQAQSSVYAELLKRHQESAQNQNVSDEQAARDFNAAQRAMQQQQQQQQQQATKNGAAPGQPAQPGQPGQPIQPGQPGQPGVPAVPPPAGAAANQQGGAATPGVPDYAKRNEAVFNNLRQQQSRMQPVRKPEPVKVPSLAAGMKGKGLSEVMKNAESLMRDGKFTSALEQYDQAEQVAPNNPLIRLGRANAELGASYYARADAHLREAFGANPELLAGQYDLAALLGEQRLQVLVRDLKELANKDQREARPYFLLSYIAYNTGHEQQAEAYLDLADKRSGGRDPFYKLLRNNWTLPAGAGGAAGAGAASTTVPVAPDLNK